MKHKKQSLIYDDVEIVREKFLTPGELFLLGYLNDFDRKKSRQLSEYLFSN